MRITTTTGSRSKYDPRSDILERGFLLVIASFAKQSYNYKMRSKLFLWFSVLYLGFWGGAIGVLGKFALVSFTPLQLIFFRLAFSILIFGLILLARQKLWITLRGIFKDARYYIFLALSGVGGGMILGFLGLRATTAISYDLLFNASGFFIVILGSWLYADKVSRLDKFLLAVAFLGMGFVVMSHGSIIEALRGGSLFGDALVILGGLGWALYTVVGARSIKRNSARGALNNVFGSFIFAAIVLGTYVFVFEPVNFLTLNAGAVTSAIVLGIFATAILFVLWFRFAETADGTATALVALSENIGGVIFPILFLGEALTWLGMIGAVLIIAPLVVREYQ